jgi:hypothetical protein
MNELNIEVSSRCDQAGLPPINWETLVQKTDEIETFLLSLKKERIGLGLVYASNESELLPRSNYFDNHTVQWVCTILEPTATFEAVQAAFKLLIEKVNDVGSTLKRVGPTQESPQTTENILVKLTRIQWIINHVAKQGLAQLVQNYCNEKKFDKATALENSGRK